MSGDDLINFEEFCQGVASLLEAPQQHQQQQQHHHKHLLLPHEEARVQKLPKDEGKVKNISIDLPHGLNAHDVQRQN